MENLKQLLENIGDHETCYLSGERIDVYADALTWEDRFYPGYGSTRGYCFAIRNKKNITIDGQGAELVFHGACSPFLFSNCEGVTLKNLKINYAVPGYVCGRITQVTDDFYDLDFSSGDFSADVTADGSLHFIDPNRERESLIRFTIVDELDAHTHLQVNTGNRYFLRLDPYAPGTRLSHMFRMARFEKIGENLIRIYAKRDWTKEEKHTVGNYILFDASGRNNVNFQFDRCADVSLEHIDMYASIGLGIITTNCRNLYFRAVNSIIKEGSGRFMAVKDDVFHLVCTKGEVIVENCRIERMIDDALNIHSFYPTIVKRVDAYSVLAEILCPQDKVFDYYNNGQQLKLLDGNYADTGLIYTIREHAYVSDKQIRLTFEEPLDDRLKEGFLLDDSADAATLLMRNCTIANTQGRVCVQSPARTVIENCCFRSISVAICINGRSKTYSESAPVTDLVIKNNQFHGLRKSPAITIGSCYNPKDEIIYGAIAIENNTFTANGGGFIALKYFDQVIMKKNAFVQNPLYAPRPAQHIFQIERCNKILYL